MKPEPLPTSTSPRPFKRLVPAPLLSLALLGLWLLLNRSLSAGHFVLGSVLLLHVLELDDAATVIADVKRRYEAPLMEIFE